MLADLRSSLFLRFVMLAKGVTVWAVVAGQESPRRGRLYAHPLPFSLIHLRFPELKSWTKKPQQSTSIHSSTSELSLIVRVNIERGLAVVNHLGSIGITKCVSNDARPPQKLWSQACLAAESEKLVPRTACHRKWTRTLVCRRRGEGAAEYLSAEYLRIGEDIRCPAVGATGFR